MVIKRLKLIIICIIKNNIINCMDIFVLFRVIY